MKTKIKEIQRRIKIITGDLPNYYGLIRYENGTIEHNRKTYKDLQSFKDEHSVKAGDKVTIINLEYA